MALGRGWRLLLWALAGLLVFPTFLVLLVPAASQADDDYCSSQRDRVLRRLYERQTGQRITHPGTPLDPTLSTGSGDARRSLWPLGTTCIYHRATGHYAGQSIVVRPGYGPMVALVLAFSLMGGYVAWGMVILRSMRRPPPPFAPWLRAGPSPPPG